MVVPTRADVSRFPLVDSSVGDGLDVARLKDDGLVDSWGKVVDWVGVERLFHALIYEELMVLPEATSVCLVLPGGAERRLVSAR